MQQSSPRATRTVLATLLGACALAALVPAIAEAGPEGRRVHTLHAFTGDSDGKMHTHTTQSPSTGGGATWGMFWGFLFGILFFVPFLGMAVGAGMGALFGHLGKGTIDKQFQDQVRDMLKPGTSALFLVVEKVTPDKATSALSKFGGTVIKTSLSDEQTSKLQDALHGSGAVVNA